MDRDIDLESSEPVLFSLLRSTRSALTRGEFFTINQAEYSTTHDVNIWTGSYNLNAQRCTQKLLDWVPSDEPHIMAFGFQEIVELNATNAILGSSGANLQAIDESLAKTLGPKYLKVSSQQLVGIYLTIWVKESIRDKVGQIQYSSLATGFGGVLGNKGGVAARMLIYDTPLVFINVHLSSGEKAKDLSKRLTEVEDVLSQLEFADELESHTRSRRNVIRLINSPTMIFCGDTNFRMDGLKDEEARLRIKQGDFRKLHCDHDQLHLAMTSGRVFRGWVEGPVEFPPTYKFKLGTNEYSGEEAGSKDQLQESAGGKKRVPAWCDRVLYKGQNLKQLSYYSVPTLTSSDHKPVGSSFIFRTLEYDRNKIQALLEKSKVKAELKLAADRPRCPPLHPNMISLGVLRYGERKSFKVVVSNTGKADGAFHFVPPPGSILSTKKQDKCDEEPGLPPWLQAYPDEGIVPCSGSKSIEMTACIDREAVRQMTGADIPASSIFILRVEDASDLFLVVNVDFESTRIFGRDLSLDLSIPILRSLVLFLMQSVSTPGLLVNSFHSLLPHIEEDRARSALSRELRPLLFSRLSTLISALEESETHHQTEERELPDGTSPHEAAAMLLLYLSELPSPLLSSDVIDHLCLIHPADLNDALLALSEVMPPTELSALKLVVFLIGKVIEVKGSRKKEIIHTLCLSIGPKHFHGEVERIKIQQAIGHLIGSSI